MATLRSVHYKDFDKFLRYVGCSFARQKGSHRIYRRSDLIRPLVVPATSQVSMTVIKSNLKTLGISLESYLEIMERL